MNNRKKTILTQCYYEDDIYSLRNKDQSITSSLISRSQCNMGKNVLTFFIISTLFSICSSFPSSSDGSNLVIHSNFKSSPSFSSSSSSYSNRNLENVDEQKLQEKQFTQSSNPSTEPTSRLHYHSHRLRHEKNFNLLHLDSPSFGSQNENLESAHSSPSSPPSSSSSSVHHLLPQQSVTWSNTDSQEAATVLKITSTNVPKEAHDQNRTRTQYFRSHRISRSGPTLEIQPTGGVQKVQAGNPFVISCMGTGADVQLFSELTWYDPRGQVIES